ncbi:phospholipase D-like domain-containing protein [Elizabethkingia miricola]|uniref:hypothetical protein n=1 Tax=Elizabethkingia miricola TaxID=172045 RepID=UPI0038911A35
MPNTGDTFSVPLKKTHLGWGTYRKTNTRRRISNEGYLPIPIKFARLFNITNMHNKKQSNVYKVSTSDGFLNDKELKASGNRKKGDMYAKNLHGNGDLKLLGTWFNHLRLQVGDVIKIEFVNPSEILLTKV